jgi:hypothetical protein
VNIRGAFDCFYVQDFAFSDGFYDVVEILRAKSLELQAADYERAAQSSRESDIERQVEFGRKEVESGMDLSAKYSVGGTVQVKEPIADYSWLESISAGNYGDDTVYLGERDTLSSTLEELASELAAVLVKMQQLPTGEERKLVFSTALAAARNVVGSNM